MIDIKKLSALEKAAKPAPWYAWLDPAVPNIEDKCITTIPEEQYIREHNGAKGSDKYRGLTHEEEVVGCSEWMRAEDADFLLIVEMRNQLPDLIACIDQLEKRNADLGAQVAALKEIAVEGWAVAEFGGEQEGQDYHLYFREWNIDRESYRKEARELLQAEHPEAFR